MTEIYLDNAATSAVRREVLEAMWPHLTGAFGNPSSRHGRGEHAAAALAEARESVAGALGARPAEIIFTGGGTESNNLAIKGVSLAAPRGRHLVISAIEHPSVAESAAYLQRAHGFEVTTLAVDATGLVDPDRLAAALRPDTTLVSIMLANNEVGTVQPLATISGLARARGAVMHSDAVQAAGWLPLAVAELGVDTLTLAGHKIGAPAGVGVLYSRARVPLEPVLHGGGQERGRRSGTENVAGAVGFATALALAELDRERVAQAMTLNRDAFIAEVLATVPGASLTGHSSNRLPSSASFCFDGTSGEAVLLELERRDILCSSGSACSAGSDEPSAVLLALGIEPRLAQTAVRFSFSASTTAEQLAQAAAAVRAAVGAVHKIAE